MPFKPGQSGNPSGRPKALVDVIALARSKTKANINRIAHLAAHAEDESVRLRASIALHEIGWGRPAQAITGPNGGMIQAAMVVRWAQPGELPE